MNKQKTIEVLKELNAINCKIYILKEKLLEDFTYQEIALMGCKIEAIKAYRNIKNCTLKEAKDSVEDYIDNNINLTYEVS